MRELLDLCSLVLIDLSYNGIKTILLLLWVEGVVDLGSRVCGSRGLWVEVRRSRVKPWSRVVGEGSRGSMGI